MTRQECALFESFIAILLFLSFPIIVTAGNELELAKGTERKNVKAETVDEMRYLRSRTLNLEERLKVLEGREIFAHRKDQVFKGETVNEKVEEDPVAETKKGISISASGTGTVQHAIGIGSHENKADGDLFGIGSVDIFLSGEPAPNTLFFVDIEAIGGFSPDSEISNISVLNSDDVRRTSDRDLNIREAWMGLELFEEQLFLYGGMIDLTNYFDANRVANDEDSQFITDTLVNNPLLGAPDNGGGIAAIYDPKTGVNFRAGIQRGDGSSRSLGQKVYSVVEIGYQSHFVTIPEGHYRAWYRHDKGLKKENTAYGFSVDQKVTPSLTLFGRFGHKFTSGQFSEDDFFYSGGFQFKNRYTFSLGDYWALGFQHTDLATGVEESLVEGYYSFNLAESFKASFHLQYLIDSNSGEKDKSYLLPGLRVHFDF
jgi:high affinity Mn2+ porin